jgi:hypothetical protein
MLPSEDSHTKNDGIFAGHQAEGPGDWGHNSGRDFSLDGFVLFEF